VGKINPAKMGKSKPALTPRKVSKVYRRRFAIESSYRMRNLVKPKTSSKNATIRYFYALISFLLKNI
jgi:putative transposase